MRVRILKKASPPPFPHPKATIKKKKKDRMMCSMEAEIWVISVQAKGYPGQEEHNAGFHLAPSQGTRPANTIILDSWPLN